MKVLRIKHTTRRYRCDVPGCGALTNNLIAKRDDAARKPAHICDDCINGLYSILHPGRSEVIDAWEAGELVERDDDGRWPDEPDDGLLPDETDAEPEEIEVHSASEYRRLDAMGVLDESSTPEKPVRKRKKKTE